jgi:hypothetical protein
MNDEDVLTPHEAAQLLHAQLKVLIRERGLTAEQAVVAFNEAARRAGLDVRVRLQDAKLD